MAKVIFEFDDKEDDKIDIDFIVNRHKILGAINDLSSLVNKIYNSKFYNNELITIKDNKVISDLLDYDFNDDSQKDYIDRNFIETELGKIFDKVCSYVGY